MFCEKFNSNVLYLFQIKLHEKYDYLSLRKKNMEFNLIELLHPFPWTFGIQFQLSSLFRINRPL